MDLRKSVSHMMLQNDWRVQLRFLWHVRRMRFQRTARHDNFPASSRAVLPCSISNALCTRQHTPLHTLNTTPACSHHHGRCASSCHLFSYRPAASWDSKCFDATLMHSRKLLQHCCTTVLLVFIALSCKRFRPFASA